MQHANEEEVGKWAVKEEKEEEMEEEYPEEKEKETTARGRE